METPGYQPPGEQLAPDYGPPPDWQSWPAYKAPTKPNRSRLKTAIGGLALAGLLVVGGAATVFAADPSPSPSTLPNVTTPTTPGTPGTTNNGGTTNGGHHGPCPNIGSGSGSTNGGTTAPSTTEPSTSGSNT
jgi:hypothetical protein